jgi:hypothetical protein
MKRPKMKISGEGNRANLTINGNAKTIDVSKA